MKPIDITLDSYAEYNENFNENKPTFKVGDTVKILNTKTFLLKDIPNLVRRSFCCY